MRGVALLLIVLMGAWVGPTDSDARVSPGSGLKPAPQGPRFLTVDVTLDPRGAALAAYQVELAFDGAVVVGVEEGGFPVHTSHDDDPLWYDPAALQQGRLILADFTTDADAALPTRAFRVATVHLMTDLPEGEKPGVTLTLHATGDAHANPIPADAAWMFGDDR